MKLGPHKFIFDLVGALNSIHPFSLPKIQAFCQKYSAKPKKDEVMNLFLLVSELMEHWLYKAVNYMLVEQKEVFTGAVPDEIQSFDKASVIRKAAEWSIVWKKITESFRQARQFHLDRYQVLIEAFIDLSS